MKRAGALAILAVLAATNDSWARPSAHAGRTLAEAPAAAEAQRVVVTEGDAKTAKLVGELEQELKASSYVIVRVPKVALEPEAMLQALRNARAARGILLSEDGKSVVVLAASRRGTTLRVYGEYSLDRDDRLARRRQWISLVERLRVPPDEDEEDKEGGPLTAAPVASVVAEAAKPTEPDVTVEPDRRVHRLGVTVALGYVTGRTGLVSHLQLVGNRRLSTRISLIAHGLWPMVPGERATTDGVRSRVWTFAGNVGLAADLGRPWWRVNPYAGMTVGMQFLLAYVDRPDDATTGIYRIASLTLDLHLGVRLLLRRGTWLLLQASGERLTSLATRPGAMTDSLADAWAVRSALGLLMAL
jgi:hypothetical protein